jgi:CRP-like cAMP-binding protein
VHQVRFEAREVLVRQGDEADCMFVIKTGQVRERLCQARLGKRAGLPASPTLCVVLSYCPGVRAD